MSLVSEGSSAPLQYDCDRVLMALYMILLIAHRRHASLTIKGIKVLPKYLCLMVLTVEVAGNAILACV